MANKTSKALSKQFKIGYTTANKMPFGNEFKWANLVESKWAKP